jgi:FAD binding domain
MLNPTTIENIDLLIIGAGPAGLAAAVEAQREGISNQVGSSIGAVIRRKLLVCVRRFRLRARLGVSVIPFPAPATSHAACGFPALRAPAHFLSTLMKPIVLERLSAVALYSYQTNRAHHTTIADSTASNRSLDAIGLWPSVAESSARPSCE